MSSATRDRLDIEKNLGRIVNESIIANALSDVRVELWLYHQQWRQNILFSC